MVWSNGLIGKKPNGLLLVLLAIKEVRLLTGSVYSGQGRKERRGESGSRNNKASLEISMRCRRAVDVESVKDLLTASGKRWLHLHDRINVRVDVIPRRACLNVNSLGSRLSPDEAANQKYRRRDERCWLLSRAALRPRAS